jgi:hypothetical protein
MKVERRKTKYCLIAIAAVLLALLAQPAMAATTWTWDGPTTNNNWNNPQNWLSGALHGVPAAGDIAILNSGTGSGSKTATYNLTPNPGVLQEIDVQNSATDHGTFTINQSSYALSAINESIGIYGNGVYNQSGGTNTITNTLALGVISGSSGTYNKSGGTFSAGAIVLGNGTGSTGTFKQSSGNVTIGNYLPDPGSGNFSLILGGTVGTGGKGTGIYTMSSGNLTVGFDEAVGLTGTGTFTQSAGNQTINGRLIVGVFGGSTGTFNMSSGTLTVNGDERIADTGTGTFTQSAGSHTITGDLEIARAAGSNGTFKMSSGSLTVGGPEIIGYGLTGASTGSFTQTSGSNTDNGDFYLGYGTGTTGNYTMTSGSLNVKGSAGEYIGLAGTGTFTQTSGSNTASKNIFIAQGVGSVGTYNLNSGSVTANFSPPFDATADIINYGSTFPSASGTGTFNVTGTATVTGDFLNFGNVTTKPGANVTWNGNFTNNNVYTSGTSAPTSTTTQTFKGDLVVNPTGYIVANSPLSGITPQDLYIFRGNFLNQSTQSALWNTANAEIEFSTGASTTHTLNINADGTAAGHPFAWATMWIDSSQTLKLTGGAGDALWVNGLVGVKATSFTSGATLTNIFNDSSTPLDIYYSMDAAFSSLNGYLGNFNYIIPADPSVPGAVAGELLTHAPLPPSVLLLGSGLLGLGAMGWRRKRLG